MLFCVDLSNAKLRPMEAMHLLVLVLFAAWMPFCFKDMNSVNMVWHGSNTSMATDVMPANIEGVGIPSVDAFPSREVGSPSARLPERIESKPDCPPERNRVLLFCFLTFAVISGGVLNLDAFDALPVL
jgi:hypothetical protein